MFTNVIDKIQGLLSRSFLLGNFFPVLVFSAVNGALTYLTFPKTFESTWLTWPKTATEQVTYLAVVFVAIAILAYTIAPLTLVLRALLEGELLPEFIRSRLRLKFIRKATKLGDAIRASTDAYSIIARMKLEDVLRLQGDRAAGDAVGTTINVPAIDAAQAVVEKITRVDETIADPNPVLLREAIDAVSAALRANATTTPANAPACNDALRLTAIQLKLVRGIANSERAARRNLETLVSKQRESLVPEDVRPTHLGNIRAVVESYSKTAYDAEFDFLWPRLQLVLVKDKEFGPIVDLAKAQLDFALLMLVLSSAVPIVWIPLLIWKATSPWLFLLIGFLGPLAAAFLYRIVEESERSFGGVIKAAIDGYRSELLAALHQPLPSTLSTERQTWRQLQMAMVAEGSIDLRLRYDKK